MAKAKSFHCLRGDRDIFPLQDDPARIATAYLVDTDGAIYEVFDPAFWAFHLGLQGTKGKHDKRSIGIEIATSVPSRERLIRTF